jgi:hypothetical protein
LNTCSTPVQHQGEQKAQQTANPSICRLPTAALSTSTATRKPSLDGAGAIEASAEIGNRRLRAYLRAPAAVRERFDERQAAAIRRDCAVDERVGIAFADDPPELRELTRRKAREDAEAGICSTIRGVNWGRSWQRRASAARRAAQDPSAPAPYCRETDPLFDVDLREVWEQLTGERIRGTVSRCPHPDHEDAWPSCAVRERLWFCNGCAASGSIIDLGALLFDEDPRGAGFFRIRTRLLAELGLDGRAAA